MRNVLVTGGAGFIGSHLVDRLLDDKAWRVSVIDDFNDFYSPEIKRCNIKNHVGKTNFQLFETDIRDFEALKKIFAAQKFDLVVHLAARAGVRPSLEQPFLYNETNVRGTLNLLEAARQFDVPQFVFGSSSSVYGSNARIPFEESASVLQPLSPYAATKAAGEMLCHTYSYLYGLRAVCLRFFTVYGARQRPDLAIHKFTRAVYERKPITVFGDGTTRRDYTYVDDIVGGVRAAMDYAESSFETFNLGESRAVELRELVALIEKELGKPAIIERHGLQAGDMLETFADISKARRLLGYNPTTPIETGIKQFVEWFLKNER
jgi:UDP-glucuronate 4-epimerase